MRKNINSLNVVNTNQIFQTKDFVRDYSNNIKFYEINTYPNIKEILEIDLQILWVSEMKV